MKSLLIIYISLMLTTIGCTRQKLSLQDNDAMPNENSNVPTPNNPLPTNLPPVIPTSDSETTKQLVDRVNILTSTINSLSTQIEELTKGMVTNNLNITTLNEALKTKPSIEDLNSKISPIQEAINSINQKGSGRFLVMHSQTQSVPSCPSGWTKLWEGYSLAGNYLGPSYDSPQDLSSPGSCAENFNSLPFFECNGSSSCEYDTLGDYSMWLTSERYVNEGAVTVDMVSKISRCVVCDGAKKILVKHSYTNSIPECPSGWESIWEGYSFGTATLYQGYSSGQDLGNTGSCLPIFIPLPVIECKYGSCNYDTSGDFTMWMVAQGTSKGKTTIVSNNTLNIDALNAVKAATSRCRVCQK